MVSKALTNLRTLVVDDDLELLQILSLSLKNNGAIVSLASGGIEALAAFSENAYDIVISDIRMPEGDGLDLIRGIRAIDKLIPILCITGFTEMNFSEIKTLGASDVLQKPLVTKDFITKIKSLTA